MKIKIGNFNFINDMENKLSNFGEFEYKNNYFWLDGKEDTLFVSNMLEFEREQYGHNISEFENELKNKYKIVNIYGKLKNQVNQYINDKVEQFFNDKNYSKYELYKEMDLGKYRELNNDKKFQLGYEDRLILDIDKNKINIGKFELNPYTEKIDNLDELFEQGILNRYIKKGLILKEIEKGIAPPYIYELKKITDFFEGKKNVNLMFKDCEKFKCEAEVGCIFGLGYGKFELDFGYGIEYNFKKENPLKKISDLKLENFKGISYGKNVLEIDGRIFANASKQIAITLEDRLKQKVDFLKEDIQEEYYNYRNKMELECDYVPYTLELAVNRIKEDEERKEKNVWYNKELAQIIHKNNLINRLEQAKTIKDIEEISIEICDDELQNIYYGMLYEEDNCEDEEEEEEEQ